MWMPLPAESARVLTLMRVSVVKMARAARSKAVGSRGQIAGRVGDALFDARHRHEPADHAGRSDQHLLGPKPKSLAGAFRHAPGVVQALFAGAGIGVAGTNDDAAGL